MDLLNELIGEAAGAAGRSKKSFNKVLMEALEVQERMTYEEVLKLNVKFRWEKKFEEDFNEENIKNHIDDVRVFIKRAKKQLRGTISNAQDIGGFNYWAKEKGHDIQIQWNDDKDIEII